ncbi:hypothetical protein QVD17_10372 [Tagetes erecta]|uniref:Reverse transcriptase zinc-binding domain-containing protein n=1 Tax=Tagetes erecta TaxID=13708 RepID=A0AAD8L2B5_TARER|nr:hypothetical protein QVD17_10372 [Tagetes erecta]
MTGKIPVKPLLLARGVQLQLEECAMCIGRAESIHHALFFCPFTSRVWEKIIDWCGIQVTLPVSFLNVINKPEEVNVGAKKKGLTNLLFMATMWYIGEQEMTSSSILVLF